MALFFVNDNNFALRDFATRILREFFLLTRNAFDVIRANETGTHIQTKRVPSVVTYHVYLVRQVRGSCGTREKKFSKLKIEIFLWDLTCESLVGKGGTPWNILGFQVQHKHRFFLKGVNMGN